MGIRLRWGGSRQAQSEADKVWYEYLAKRREKKAQKKFKFSRQGRAKNRHPSVERTGPDYKPSPSTDPPF